LTLKPQPSPTLSSRAKSRACPERTPSADKGESNGDLVFPCIVTDTNRRAHLRNSSPAQEKILFSEYPGLKLSTPSQSHIVIGDMDHPPDALSSGNERTRTSLTATVS